MKLLFCEYCHDIFKPGPDTLRTCACGRVKGRYINNKEAEVSAEAISIAIDNYSLAQAIADMRRHQAETGDTAAKEDYYEYGNGAIECAWVRPNTAPGNPHTRLLGGDADSSDGAMSDRALTGDSMMQMLEEHVAAQHEAAAIIRSVFGANNAHAE
jgi:hypothetical protein